MTRTKVFLSALVALAGVTAPVTPASAASFAPAAESVSVVRTGGFAGSQASFQVSGSGTKQSAEVLRLASGPAFRALRPRYVPKNTCCDRYLYRVEVRYRNGRVKDVTALQGAPAPRVLWDVIKRVENMPAPSVKFPAIFPFG
ncbi:hypothetical protein [Actinoplanes sp. GCM10030250]|uniref:hypothetical protein n=1 Tax=Actinoplanes sp. GCM10030250 TaxID=3273376 RepID=UPI0036200148